jgi:hypothetical protein
MANLSVQTNASIEANATQINALLQQLAANNNQLNLQQQAILQQMVMLSTNPPPTRMARTYVPPAPHIFSPPPLQGYKQQYQQMVPQPYQQHYQQRGGGRGGGSWGGCTCCQISSRFSRHPCSPGTLAGLLWVLMACQTS